MLWAICRAFNVLPNDPLIQKLQPLQIVWILSNLNQENEELKKITSSEKEVSSFEMDDETFFEMVKNLKHGR